MACSWAYLRYLVQAVQVVADSINSIAKRLYRRLQVIFEFANRDDSEIERLSLRPSWHATPRRPLGNRRKLIRDADVGAKFRRLGGELLCAAKSFGEDAVELVARTDLLALSVRHIFPAPPSIPPTPACSCRSRLGSRSRPPAGASPRPDRARTSARRPSDIGGTPPPSSAPSARGSRALRRRRRGSRTARARRRGRSEEHTSELQS